MIGEEIDGIGLALYQDMNAGDHTTLHQGGHTMNSIYAFINDETGATALEYGLLAALIGAVILGAVTTLGQVIANTFNSIASSMTAAS